MKKELYEVGRIKNFELADASRADFLAVKFGWGREDIRSTRWPWLKDAVDKTYDPAHGCYIYYGLRDKEKKYKSVILRILQFCKNIKLLSRG